MRTMRSNQGGYKNAMRHFKLGLAVSGLALLFAGCGGGGDRGGNSSGGGTANNPPAANAGPAQTVTSGVTVTLTGAGSSDIDGTIASYAWTQTVGTAVTLSSATVVQP